MIVPLYSPLSLRYLSITKAIYKELVTVYKDSKTAEVKISGKVFEIENVSGLELFQGKSRDSRYNHLYLIVDPMKKTINVMKNTFHNFW
jgi:hypothetical protein